MTEPPPTRIAVWGLGRHAFKTVLPALAMARCLIGVYSRNPDSRAKAEREYGCATWQSGDALLADPKVDAVYLATPTGVHHAQAQRILEAKKHLLCEKSLTNDLQLSLDLVARARKNRVLLFETFMYLYHPRFLDLQKLLTEGAIGRVVSITSAFHLPPLEAPGFRYDPAKGGSALFDVGCYPLSLVLALEPLTPTVVYASLDRQKNWAIDTGGVAVVRMEKSGSAYLSWGYESAYRNDVVIVGEEGTLQLDRVFSKGGADCVSLIMFDRYGRPSHRGFPLMNSFVGMLTHVSTKIEKADYVQSWCQAESQARLLAAVVEKAGTRGQS